jgi:PAS domain S-box-containing protein
MLRIHEDSLAQTVLWNGYHRRKDGSTFPVEVRISGVRVNSEFFVVGVARDVTEARRAETALRESEARCRMVVEKSTDFIGFLGRDGQIQFVGPAVNQLLGFEPGELVGRHYMEFVAPQDAALAGGVITELVANQESERKVRVAILRKGGGSRGFDFVARNLLEVPAVGGILILGEAVDE